MSSSSHSTADAPSSRALILALMVTRRCNMTCGHCSVESGPQVKTEPSLDELRSRIADAAMSGVHSILFTGGEPMLREKDVLALVRETRRLGMKAFMATNGFWGTTPAQATRTLGALKRAGLVALTISPDRYHAVFQGIEPALNISRAAAALNVPLNVNLTRAGGDADLDGIVASFEKDVVVRNHVRLRFYDVQPVGRARRFDAASLRGEVEGLCAACRLPAVTDDGRMTACNGPSYFAPERSPLNVGSLRTESFETLIRKHAADPVLDTIRTFGPGRLRDELRQIPGFDASAFDRPYSGMCQLCTGITSNEHAVAALRARLSGGKFEAEREAKRFVIRGQRREGLNFGAINSSERARVFWHAARGEPWPSDATQILGRADLDWKKTAEYLVSCGLARPLVARLDDAELTRWAPTFFLDRIRAVATRDALRELLVRDILERLDAALQALGADGVLLKSAAFAASAERSGATRTGSDVDVWVAPAQAEALRAHLVERGFGNRGYVGRTGAHHLAPVFFRGIPVEIHTRLLPAFWGLPEEDMLERSAPLDGFARLQALDRESGVLHAAVHCTTHLFSRGLKTAWDIAEYMRPAGFDWQRLRTFVERSAAPRAFWTPLNAFRRDLRLEVPEDFLSHGARDARQARLDLIGRRRAYTGTEAAEDVNPFSKNAVFLMLCDTSRTRAKLVMSLLSRDAAAARQNAWRQAEQASSTPLGHQLLAHAQQAWRQWRDYRSVVNSPAFSERVAEARSGRRAAPLSTSS